MKKTCIVTGAASGIGAACARLLASKGYLVWGISRRAVCPYTSEGFTYISGDIRSPEDREGLLDIASSSGRLDLLVNCAGVAPRVRDDILDMTEESYDEVTDINLRSVFFLTQSAARRMLAQQPVDGVRAVIVNISSCSAYTASVNRAEYCVSKAGVSMLTKLFASRLAGCGIPVNEICPGIIDTEMTSAAKEKYDRLIAGGLVPQNRWGEPDDIARAVLALADGSLSYMTGESLRLDGGLHIRTL